MMNYSPIAIKRSHVLGKIYNQCDPIQSIPVYLDDQSGELLGYVDESLGHYADAFIFNLSEAVCKQLSASLFDYAFGFEYLGKAMLTASKKRIRLKHILLIVKKNPSQESIFCILDRSKIKGAKSVSVTKTFKDRPATKS